MKKFFGLLPPIVTFEFPSSTEAAAFFCRVPFSGTISYRVVEVQSLSTPMGELVEAARELGGKEVSS